MRKHAGMIVPWPVQAAMIAALTDDEHVTAQRERYAARRAALLPAVRAAGFEVTHSEAGLYLWASRVVDGGLGGAGSAGGARGENCRDTVAWLAERGILVAPGDFYGPAGASHVRFALTATDERIAAAADRLTSSASA